MADIGQLVVKIGADATELQKALQQIEHGGSKAALGIEKAGKIMAGAFLATATAIVYMTVQAGKQAEEIEQLSTMTGIATDTLQGYQVLLARTGLTNQDLAMGFKTLSTNIREAQNETSTAAKAFYALGISIKGNEEPSEVLRQIAERLGTMPDGFQKSALATDLFGRAGQRMLVAFKGGAASIDAAMQKAQEFGLILQSSAIEKLSRMDDAIDDLGSALKGFQLQVGLAFAPLVEVATVALTGLIAKATGVVKGFNEAKTATEGFAQALIEMNRATGATGATAGKGKGPLSVGAVTDEMMEEIERMQKKVQTPGGVQQTIGAQIVRETPLAIEVVKRLGTSFEIAMSLVHGKRVQDLDDIIAQRKAQTELGKAMVENFQRTQPQLAPGAGVQLPGGEALKGALIVERTQQAHQAMLDIEKQEAAELLRRLELSEMFGTTIEEQIKNEKAGAAAVAKGVKDYEQRFAVLEQERDLRQVLLEEQKVYFQMDSDFSDKVGAARRVALEAQNAAEALATAKLKDEYNGRLGFEQEYQDKLAIIRQRGENDRKKITMEFPTFWEKQLNDLAASNSFSMGLMVSTWSNAIATMAVKGGNLKAAWEATEIAVIQGAINMSVAAAASALKSFLVNEAAAAGTEGVWAGAGAFVVGVWGTVTSAMASMFAALVGIVTAVGTAIMGVLTAIAGALSATVFGIPYAGAILVGVAAILGSLVALKAIKFAEGGIVTGPMLGMVGEAGPEAIIPLDRAGSMLGGGGDRPIVTNISIDGKKFMKAVSRYTAAGWRHEGASA